MRALIDQIRAYMSSQGLGPILVRSVTGSAGLRVAGMGFTFLVGIQLARGLGAAGYGVYGLAMSIIAVLTVPTEFGLPQLLTREVAASDARRDWGSMKGAILWASRASLLIAFAMAGGLVLFVAWNQPTSAGDFGFALLAGTVMLPLVAQVSIRAGALRGLRRIVLGQVPDVLLRPLFHSALLFGASGFLALPWGPALALLLGAASAGLALVVAQGLLIRALPEEVRAATAATNARAWWSSALPMALTEGMRLLQAHVVILMLGWLVALPEVGVYRVATSIMVLVAFPVSLFNIVSMPIVARLHVEQDERRLQRTLTFVALGMTVGVAILTAPFAISGSSLLSLFFGTEFASGDRIVLVLCLSALISAVFGANAVMLNMTGAHTRVTRASAYSLLLLVVTSVPLISALGTLGAAYASLASVFTWNLLMWIDCLRLRRVDTSIFSLLRMRASDR